MNRVAEFADLIDKARRSRATQGLTMEPPADPAFTIQLASIVAAPRRQEVADANAA